VAGFRFLQGSTGCRGLDEADDDADGDADGEVALVGELDVEAPPQPVRNRTSDATPRTATLERVAVMAGFRTVGSSRAA
jgi:hypothetical protein